MRCCSCDSLQARAPTTSPLESTMVRKPHAKLSRPPGSVLLGPLTQPRGWVCGKVPHEVGTLDCVFLHGPLPLSAQFLQAERGTGQCDSQPTWRLRGHLADTLLLQMTQGKLKRKRELSQGASKLEAALGSQGPCPEPRGRDPTAHWTRVLSLKRRATAVTGLHLLMDSGVWPDAGNQATSLPGEITS